MIGFHSLEHLNLVKFGLENWDYIPSLFTNLLFIISLLFKQAKVYILKGITTIQNSRTFIKTIV